MYVPRAYEEYDINTNAENWVEKVPRICKHYIRTQIAEQPKII